MLGSVCVRGGTATFDTCGVLSQCRGHALGMIAYGVIAYGYDCLWWV